MAYKKTNTTRVALFYSNPQGILTKREEYRNLSTHALRNSYLRLLTWDSVIVIHGEHSTKCKTWLRMLSNYPNLKVQHFVKEKVVIVCEKGGIGEEHFNRIIGEELWKSSRFGNFYSMS